MSSGPGEEAHGVRPAALDRPVAARGEVGGGGVVDAVAGLLGAVPESDRQHRLAHTRPPDEEDVGRLLDEAQGAQLLDQLAVEAWLGLEVEVLQTVRGGQAREAAASSQTPFLGRGDLHGQQPLQEGGVAQVILPRPLELAGERLGGGAEPQVGEMGAQALVGADRLRHLGTSTSSA
jgi:hypothetical protein